MVPALAPYSDSLPRPFVDGGYYAKTPDNRPLVGAYALDGSYALCGLSGYGIMTAAAAGELLAAHGHRGARSRLGRGVLPAALRRSGLRRGAPPTTSDSSEGVNYLAHLLLTEPTPEGLVGALLGDRVKGTIDPDLAPGIRRAIALHRRIDSYTDAHPVHRRSRSRFEGAPAQVRRDHRRRRLRPLPRPRLDAARARRARDLRRRRVTRSSRLARGCSRLACGRWSGG